MKNNNLVADRSNDSAVINGENIQRCSAVMRRGDSAVGSGAGEMEFENLLLDALALSGLMDRMQRYPNKAKLNRFGADLEHLVGVEK